MVAPGASDWWSRSLLAPVRRWGKREGKGREKGGAVLLQRPGRNMVISTRGGVLWAVSSFQASFCPHVEESDTRPSCMTCLSAFGVWLWGRTSKTAPLEATTVHLGLWVICTCERLNVKSPEKKSALWMFGFVFEVVEELNAGEAGLNPARARARHQAAHGAPYP